jgi:plastocyanin
LLFGVFATGGRGLAAAQTYRVQLDAPPPPGQPWAFLKLFPADYLTVAQGDVINAAWDGTDTPHTATFIPSSHIGQWRGQNQQPGGPYEVFQPEPSNDEKGAVLNSKVVAPSDPSCGTLGSPCTFDGTAVVNSGINFPNPNNQPSFYATVTAPVGQYALLCLLHPGMEIPLIVVAPGTDIPSPAEVSARAAAQAGFARRILGRLADQLAQSVKRVGIGGGHTRFVISAGGFVGNVSANEYLDHGLTLHVGDQLRVKASGEIHTATFPGDSYKTVPFTIPQCEVSGNNPDTAPPCGDPSLFELGINGKAITPSKSNGLWNTKKFVNSGLLGPIVPSYTFVALKPGTYTMVCLVHGPEMSTTITVVP